MIDLDTRARSAAIALHESVADTDLRPMPGSGTVASGPAGFRPIWATTAGALTALVVIVGVWSLRPTVVGDDVVTTTTVTTVATTATTATTPATTTVPTSAPPPTAVPAVAPSTSAVPDTDPPPIAITDPFDGEVFDEKSITFAGTTEPGARVFGGPYEADVDAAGTWSIVLILSEGPNRATFRAVDAAGNESTATVTAVYEPPAPEEPAVAEFVAHQTWGVCESIPPFEEFYGKGQPGSWVEVVSDHGSGETLVKPNGEWYLKVVFPELPPNTPIVVQVRDQFGRSRAFEFVAVG